MPAAAVIPAPIAYIKVVAVKKLVVGSRFHSGGTPCGVHCLGGRFCWFAVGSLNRVPIGGQHVYFEKNWSAQSRRYSLNISAWNNGIGSRFYFVGFRSRGND